MTRPAFHSTWTRMQGLDGRRRWLRFGEIAAAVKAAGLEVSETRLRNALTALPRPEKRYGMYLYTRHHMAAVVEGFLAAAQEWTDG